MLRLIELQVRVLLHHGQVVTGVVGGNVGLFVLHGIEDLVHNVLLHHRLLLSQLVGAGLELGRIGSVHRVAQQILGNAEGIPGVVEHQDLARVLLIPQQLPAGDICLVYILAVVDDAHGAPGVGHGVLVLGIVAQPPVGIVNILGVGDVVVIQLLEHTLLAHPADHIVGGDDHIHSDAAVFQLGVHGLVGIKGGVLHLDVGVLLLKLSNHINGIIIALSDVLAPVVDIDGGSFFFLAAAGEEAEGESGNK